MFVSGLGSWDVGLVTPALDLSIGGWAEDILFVSGLGSWGIGLVFLKLGLRQSSVLNKKLCLFLDSEAGVLDLSLQHWTCHFEAGPSAQLHS